MGCATIIVLAGVSRVWLAAHWTGDVLAAYAFGGFVLTLVVAAYVRVEPTIGRIPLVRAAPVPYDPAIPHARALTSTVLFRGDQVVKIYNPGFIPRLLYWGAFQAPFGYTYNRLALEAAVLRRNLAGRLTEYWYGSNRVAPALGVEEIDGRLALVGHFVDGVAPRDSHAARSFLFDLAGRFDAAGLPTWQVDPRQPRSLGNIIETPAGDYAVIDLESGIVSPLASPRAWGRAIRRAQVPLYDDVYFDVTRAYIEGSAAAIQEQMGADWLAGLRDLAARAEAAASAWHRSEPRVWSALLRAIGSGCGLRHLPARIRAKTAAGHAHADEWVAHAIQRWRDEGRIDDAEAERLRVSVADPGLQSVMPHFGVHLVIGIALRFPVGTIARVTYTGGNLLIATLRLALRRIDRRAWRVAASVHSPLVIMVACLPAVGTFSYLVAKPVRSKPLLARVVLDGAGEKLPWGVYRKAGLKRLVAGHRHEVAV
jgi:hypothetical protein